MATVAVHPPRTPVTKGSFGRAKNTIPNMCKMPGPPAPFVPAPLPNIGMSNMSPQGYSTTVKIEGNAVAIRGATFGSFGDIASKPLGGGIVSMNTHGPTKFVGPGSLTVKIQGKNVQLLGDPMLNNCGPAGSPANSATLKGVDQLDKAVSGDPCEALKVKFSLVLDGHDENRTNENKKAGHQSHHIFQNAILGHIVDKGLALTIMLQNSKGNTEHCDVNGEQRARNARKKPGSTGTGPSKNFGELKKNSRDDLAKGLARREDAAGNKMTPEEAETAADCIIIEAEEVAKDLAKRKGVKLNDDTPLDPLPGCFAAGTPVRLQNGELRPVESLRRGDWIATPSGGAELTRVEACHHPLVALAIGETTLVVAVNHRFFDAAGQLVRAGELRAGDRVQSRAGLRVIERARVLAAPRTIYLLGVSGKAACFLGASDILAELPDAGPPLEPWEPVVPFSPQEAACPS